MPSHTIGELLAATDELKALSARTRRLRELQTLYLRSAPRELAGSSRVKSYKAGVLCVTADNGAIAAKLKQLAPTLLASIRKNDAQITGIRIEVQVGKVPKPEPVAQRNPLPDQVLEEFDTLARRVRPGPLKLALANLVKRQRRQKRR